MHRSSYYPDTPRLFLSLSLWCPFSTGASGTPTSGMKSFLPLSSSASLHPLSVSALSCQEAALDALALPLYSKAAITPSSTTLPSRAFTPPGADRLRSLSSLSPLTDLPLLSVLQAKKAPHCRDPCLHGSAGSSPCTFPLHSPLSPHGPSLLPRLSDTAGPYCLYRYSIPLNPQLTAISRHGKLVDNTTDCLLRQSPWQPTTNHCLWQLDRTFKLLSAGWSKPKLTAAKHKGVDTGPSNKSKTAAVGTLKKKLFCTLCWIKQHRNWSWSSSWVIPFACAYSTIWPEGPTLEWTDI